MLFILSEASFVCLSNQKPGAQDTSLFVEVASLRYVGNFVSSTDRYLWLLSLWMLSDYLYFVEVLHGHLLNFWTSLRTMLQSQTTRKEG